MPCPSNLLDLIILNMYDEDYKLCISWRRKHSGM
jgi:hypothetical protein